LFLSIRENREDIVTELLKLEFDVNDTNIDDERPIDFTWKLNFYEIALKLLHGNSPFPQDYQANKNPEIQQFLDMCEGLHKNVKEGDLESLSLNYASYKHLRYVYNRKNVSLLANAIEQQQTKIISFLIDKDMNTGSHESYIYNIKTKLRDANQINSYEPENYLSIILSKCRIANSVPNEPRYWKCISDALNEINLKFPNVLKMAAEAKSMKIYFDLDNENINRFDPFSPASARSVTYGTGTTMIAAKNLLNETRKFEVVGGLAHEIYHGVMDCVYWNGCKPYPMGESEEKNIFKEAVKECKNNEKVDVSIKRYFNIYGEQYCHSEIVTAVVQMPMMYLTDTDRLKKVKNSYAKLFSYHEKIVEPELKATLPLIKILNDKKQQIKFENLTKSWKATILHARIKVQGKDSTFDNLIGNNSKVFRLLTSKNIREMVQKVCALEILKPIIDEEEGVIIERKYLDLKTTAKDDNNIKKVKVIGDLVKLRNILLADHPGSGKTKTFSNLSQNSIIFGDQYFAFLVSLQNQREVFESSEKFRDGLEVKNVVEFLVSLLKLKVELEIEIFRALFQQNKIVLLFDGFDEIDYNNIEFFIKILQKIDKETENKIWITSRPEHVKFIKRSINVDVYKHIPFTPEENKQLLKGKYIYF